jgi:hypothetical protein
MFGTAVAVHDDAMFSIWRISWIAHALARAPAHLLDGNIFYPAVRTLTFSDATLLEGLLAAPLLWARVSPTITYNLLLLGGIAGSGFAMFVLARRLVGSDGPALVAAAIFAMTPYRIEHFMHLELQWAMWIPLTFWALHRAIEEPSPRAGVLAGVFLALQVVSCVYYGVFLAIVSVPFVLLMVITRPHEWRRAVPSLLWAVSTAVLLTAPYAWFYLKTAANLGPRNLAEVASYSARPISYLTAPPQNWLWGWTGTERGFRELNLYPGIAAVLAALAAWAFRPRRLVIVYTVITAFAIELSFGLHGRLFPQLVRLGLLGLRSPARSAILAACGIAVLAAFGVSAIRERVRGYREGPALATILPLLLISADYANTGMYLMTTDYGEATVYRVLRSADPGVVIELPLPVPDGLPGRDAQYEFWSISHWHPLVNGYSGYYTPEYIQTLDRMRTFPDDRSIDRLKTLGVRYLVVHRALFVGDEAVQLLLRIGQHPELRSYGVYKDPVGVADLFVLD